MVMEYHFEWDPIKAQGNLQKHGITFELATKVFNDPMALTVYDEDNASSDQDRWVTLGLVNGYHYLVVAHTFVNEVDQAITIRLISARTATKHEIKQYQG